MSSCRRRRRHWHARDEGGDGGDLASVSWVSCASVVRCLGAVARDGGGDVRVGGGDGDDARGWDDDRAGGGAGASRESSIDVRGARGANERGGNARGRDGCVVVPDADRRRTSGWIGGDERVHHVARIGGHGTRVGGRGDADRDAETREVRWIFPTAKTVPVTLNGGMRMTAWFDLNALDESSIVDDRGMIEESARYVDALVREQMEKGIPSEKIIVAGFSQGGAIALTASLRSEVKLGGCMALSTYLPLRGDYPEKFGPHARGLKILQGHGTHDMVLQYTYGQKSYELLKEKGIDVEFKTYAGMAHSACAEEFDDIADFFGFDTRRVVAVCNKYDEYLPYPYCTFTSNELHYNTTFFGARLDGFVDGLFAHIVVHVPIRDEQIDEWNG